MVSVTNTSFVFDYHSTSMVLIGTLLLRPMLQIREKFMILWGTNVLRGKSRIMLKTQSIRLITLTPRYLLVISHIRSKTMSRRSELSLDFLLKRGRVAGFEIKSLAKPCRAEVARHLSWARAESWLQGMPGGSFRAQFLQCANGSWSSPCGIQAHFEIPVSVQSKILREKVDLWSGYTNTISVLTN